jgi:membrane-associated phospholipid phosphatase
MRNDNRHTLGLTLLAAGAAAAVGFVATTRAVRAQRTREVDKAMRRRVPHGATMDTPHGRGVEQAQKVGKWWVQSPLAVAASAMLWRAGHRRAAGAVAFASVSGALVAEGLDKALFRRHPPPGHPKPDTPSYPSGHAIQLAAASLTLGWVVTRERLAPAAVAMPLAIGFPLASTAGRIWQDRHWASDVFGGWLAALALASLSTSAYEMLPRELPPSRPARRKLRAARKVSTRLLHRARAFVDEVMSP